MIYGITVEQWQKKYPELEPFDYPCHECGRILTTSIPFAWKQIVGLTAPECECGFKGTPYVYMRDPKYGDLLAMDKGFGEDRPK